MSVLGVDLAAGARKTYACGLQERNGALLGEIFASCTDDRLLELAEGREKVAIDAPFGWPSAFVDALQAHRRFEAWPAPDDGPPEDFRASLSFRATDRVVMQTRRPLSVSTDKLGVTAMRCAHLLHRWFLSGAPVDRAGRGSFVEVYPAAALDRWGLPGSGYKASDKAVLEDLVEAVFDAVPALELSADDRQACATSDDAFDALVAALVARAALLGLTDPPPRALSGQAAEEGWIHLPLRGSLPLLGLPSPALRAAPEQALAARLAEQGVAVDPKGYAGGFDDVVLPQFSSEVKAAIRADLSGKGGAELEARVDDAPRFHAAHSSACLAANVFGPWRVVNDDVPFDGRTFTGDTHLEVECSFGLSRPATLDCVVDGTEILAIESKFTETFRAHEAKFSDAYHGVVAELADPTWRDEYQRLCNDPKRFRFLDAAQLVKHYLGLRCQYGDRQVTLAYVYWEPADAAEVGACMVHRAEVAEFARRVADPRVRFVAMSHPDLWAAWALESQPTWLREHVAALRRRYDVSIAVRATDRAATNVHDAGTA